MSCPGRVHLFHHYLIIFLPRVNLQEFNFFEHWSLFSRILFKLLHPLLFPHACLSEIKPHTSQLQRHTEGKGSWRDSQKDCAMGAAARNPNFHHLSSSVFELQNYPCCNNSNFIVYCLLTLQNRSALGSLGWKILATYILLLLLSLRLFTNRSVKADSEQVLLRLLYASRHLSLLLYTIKVWTGKIMYPVCTVFKWPANSS